MWIKAFHLLWIKFHIEGKRFLSISFPIPLYIFQELLDCFLDLLTVVCFFVPKVSDTNSSSPITMNSVKAQVMAVIKLLDSLIKDEPYDLVDVTTDKVQVLVKIM